MYALDAETGVKRWQFELDDEVRGLLGGVDGTLYAATWDRVYALTTDGTLEWVTPSSPIGTATVGRDTLYVAGSRELRAISLQTARQEWGDGA